VLPGLWGPCCLVKEVLGVIFVYFSLNLSKIIFFTLVEMSDMMVKFSLYWLQKYTFWDKYKEI